MGEAALGVYVYGVVSGDQPLPSQPGINGLHLRYAIPWEELRAVVSQVPLAEFGEVPLQEKVQDLRWLAEKVQAHEAIVEQVMRQQPILPCKFCTIYRCEGRVREMLACSSHQCRDALAFLHDKEEWGVKAYVEEEILRRHLLQTDSDLSEMAQERLGQSPGWAYLLKKTLEQRLTERTEHTLAHLSLQLARQLRTYAVRAEEMSPSARCLCPPGTRMLLSAAYLIAKARVGSFVACVKALDEQIAPVTVRLVLSGPWPPYHFSPRLEP